MDLRKVRAIVTDREVLASLDPDAVRRYLRQTGWTVVAARRTHAVWIRRTPAICTRSGEWRSDVLTLPNDPGSADYATRAVSYLVTAAVTCGGLPPAEVIPSLLGVLALVLALVATVGPLLIWLYLVALVTFQWEKNAALRQPIEAVLLPGELVLRTSLVETRMRWAAIGEVSEGRRVYRLHLRASRQVVSVPKRVMAGAGGAAELGKLLRSLVSEGTVARTRTTP